MRSYLPWLSLLLSLEVLACSATGGDGATDLGTGSSEQSGVAGNSTSRVPLTDAGTPATVDITQNPNEDCDSTLPVVYRDFDVSHPDFEMEFTGEVVRRGLVEPILGGDSKPVFLSTTGCPWDEATPTGCSNWTVEVPEIESADTFNQWYRDVEGINYRFDKELVLVETPAGSGTFVFDTTEFFPLSQTEGFGATPPEHINQNFLFTTEIHLLFTYVPGQKFTFRGDDDLWIFINKKLALDLGGMHNAALGTIDFDAQAAALGIGPGGTYSMDIFHAERHTTASNFRVETNISCFIPVVIR